VACPLDECVRGVASKQATMAGLRPQIVLLSSHGGDRPRSLHIFRASSLNLGVARNRASSVLGGIPPP